MRCARARVEQRKHAAVVGAFSWTVFGLRAVARRILGTHTKLRYNHYDDTGNPVDESRILGNVHVKTKILFYTLWRRTHVQNMQNADNVMRYLTHACVHNVFTNKQANQHKKKNIRAPI